MIQRIAHNQFTSLVSVISNAPKAESIHCQCDNDMNTLLLLPGHLCLGTRQTNASIILDSHITQLAWKMKAHLLG